MHGRLGQRRERRSARWLTGGVALALAATALVVGGPAEASFPGVNGDLACQSTRTGGQGDVFSFDPSGTEIDATNLTNTPAPAVESKPRYSPDGREIAFESNRDGNTDIYIANADGSSVRQLTFTSVGSNSVGSWSPDASAIVFQSTRDTVQPSPPNPANFEVYRINVDGTNETRLSNRPVEDSLPVWSPDGRTIAFSSRLQDPATDVHLMDPDGNVLSNVTNSPGEDSWPSWSPDGTQIAFHSRLDDPQGEEIYRINANGTGRTRLTFNNVQVPVPPGPVESFDIFPTWSPDGTRIVWNSGRGAANFGEIYHMSAVDGSGIVRVTNNPAIDQRCDWQPLCTIYGSGNIVGTAGNDVICGSPGNDFIAGLGGNDTILGLGGNDSLAGGPGSDNLFGGFGNDRVTGGDGNDVVSGGPGDDQVGGDAGTDHADGGYGTDTCLRQETQRECP